MKHGEPIDITKRFHDRSFISCNVDQIPKVVEKVVSSAVNKVMMIFKSWRLCIRVTQVLKD